MMWKVRAELAYTPSSCSGQAPWRKFNVRPLRASTGSSIFWVSHNQREQFALPLRVIDMT